MTSPTSSLNSQIPMDHQKHKLVLEEEEEEEEEEEVPSLQSRQSQLHSSNNINSNTSTAVDTTTLLVDISSTNGNGKGNENGSLISSSSHSSINDDSETPKIEVSSPCGSPHKPSVDEQGAHNLSSVYFDQHHGIWKCHRCNWTYCVGTPWIDHVQNHKKCSRTLINFENFNQQESCFLFQTKGPNSIDGVSDVNCGGVTCSVLETSPGDVEFLVKNSEIQKSLIKDVNLQSRENSDNEGFSGSSLTPLKETFEEHNFKSKSSGSETRVAGELDLIEEIDQEVTELDVEKVLEKQNTHDLYCPNCNSCITRKVILRRRTWKIRKARRKPKHAKADTIVPSELDANSTYSDANSADGPGHDIANICSNDCPTPAIDDNNCDREPDVFRCLSCFSFFIPAGNSFKLPRVSSTENENVQDSQKSTANTNWFFSIFATHERKTTTEQGNAAADLAEVDGMNQDTTPSFSNNVTPSNGSDRSVMPPADRTMVNTRKHPDGSDSKPHQSGTESLNPSLMEPLLLHKSPGVDLRSNLTVGDGILADRNAPRASVDFPLVESSSIAGLVNDMRGVSREGGMGIVSSSAEQKFNESALTTARENSGDVAENSGGVNLPEYSTSESLIPEQSEKQLEENFNMAIGNEKSVQHGQASSTQGTSLPSQLYSEGGFINDAALKLHEVGKDSLNSLSEGNTGPEKERVNVEDKAINALENKNIGNDVIVTIEKEPLNHVDSEIVCIDSVETTSLLNSTNQTNMGGQRGAGVCESQQWEILKSIVYGGLVESITSLGVVSSSAGAGAATLNIIALGLANLIGGLFIIGHNLMDLKNHSSNDVNEHEDRYQKTLGRRDNFQLHVTVSILSFLIFGLLPPVMYGFSFRKSDDRDLKLAAVGGASLICIILLAIGKAHVQSKQPKPYFSTVFYFFSIGLIASGASYIAGDLISKLLQKISGFESSLSFQDLKPTEPTARAIY